MDKLTNFLQSLRLDKYAGAFRDAEVEFGDLAELSEDDLKELGLPLGPRRRLLRAVREPEQTSAADTESTVAQAEIASSAERGASFASAERRQLTVMFADLVGSTALAEKLDPEELRLINLAFQDAAKDAVDAFDGYVARYMGDGVLAYFGYPVAHENDAERSVRAGLRLIEAMARNAKLDALAVRIGISTGPVVVGDLIGEGASQESAVVGETPNRAARLQSLAEPNAIIVSEVTQDLIGAAFDFKAHPATTLKGFSESESVYEVLGERVGETRFRSRTFGELSPLVGRDEEMVLLRSRWDRAKSGRGAATLIVGEAGIGKSRLVEETSRYATDDGAGLLRVQCSEYHRNTPFFPLLNAFDAIVNKVAPDPSARAGTLRDIFASQDVHTEFYPFLLCDLLDLRATEPAPANLKQLEPEAKRRQTIAALVALLIYRSQSDGLVCVFEDLHWADPSTLDFLSTFVHQLVGAPILALCSTRPERTVTWADLPQSRVVSLGRLEGDDARRLAASVSTLDEATLTKVADRAGGNPLFVEELALSLADTPRGAFHSDIPTTLQDSLMARLEAIGIGRSVAQSASVLGREFSEAELRAVWDGEPTALSAGVSAMIDAGLLFERHGADGRLTYAFKHALIRDAAYSTLLSDRRRVLHQLAADFLVSLRSNASRVASHEVIAEHLIEAGDVSNALNYWLKAGEAATNASSYRECEAHLTRALGVIDAVGDGRFESQELEILVLLGPALMTQYGYSAENVGRVYARARELSEARPDKPHLTPILNGLRLQYICRHGVGKGREPSEALLLHAEAINDDASRIEGGKALGSTLLWSGADFDTTRDTLTRALTLYEQGPNMDIMRVDSDSGMTCHSFLSILEWATGNLEQSLLHSERALALAQQSNRDFGIGEALSFRAFVLFMHRENEASVEAATEGVGIAEEHDFILWKCLSSLSGGAALVDLGQYAHGLRQLQTARELLENMGYVLWRSLCEAHAGRAHAHLGELDEALNCTSSAASFALKNEELLFLPDVYQITGEVHRRHGDTNCARDAFEQALASALEAKHRMAELRACTGLAVLSIEEGSKRQAIEVLEPVYQSLAKYANNADVRDAKRVLADAH